MTPDTAAREETPVEGALPSFGVPDWRQRFGVVAGITGRGKGFDLGLQSTDPAGTVMGRWRTLLHAHPGFVAVAQGHQVHGHVVAWHEPFRGWLRLDDTDGHATAARGVLLAVTVADCIPVYLVAPRVGAVALLHAGWRGAAGRILEHGLALLNHHGASTDDVIMHCGVGICGSCYQVGSEVLEAFGFRGDGPGPWAIDLRERLADQARLLGLAEVSLSPWCSKHHGPRFYSHRGGDAGRMVAYLGLPIVP